MLILITPCPVVTIPHVADAPTPPPPDIVMVGGTTYPAPALVSKIFSTEVTPPLVVINPTAVALSPICPVGDEVIPIIGVEVYP